MVIQSQIAFPKEVKQNEKQNAILLRCYAWSQVFENAGLNPVTVQCYALLRCYARRLLTVTP
jgi:hypothetical protein